MRILSIDSSLGTQLAVVDAATSAAGARALQVLSLLRATLVDSYGPDVDRAVLEAALTSSESIVTFRRRYRGRSGVPAVLELLVVDASNTRSVAYQLQRMLTDLRAIPNTSPTARPLRLLDRLVEKVRLADPVDVVAYVRRLEQLLIDVCAELGLATVRVEGRSGVWTTDGQRKVAAIGIRVARGVTMHGFALNCDPDLSAYGRIVPCGIADATVTSLSQELGRDVPTDDALPVLELHLPLLAGLAAAT